MRATLSSPANAAGVYVAERHAPGYGVAYPIPPAQTRRKDHWSYFILQFFKTDGFMKNY